MNIHLYYKRYCTTTETGTNQAICTVIKRANKKKKKMCPSPLALYLVRWRCIRWSPVGTTFM